MITQRSESWSTMAGRAAVLAVVLPVVCGFSAPTLFPRVPLIGWYSDLDPEAEIAAAIIVALSILWRLLANRVRLLAIAFGFAFLLVATVVGASGLLVAWDAILEPTAARLLIAGAWMLLAASLLVQGIHAMRRAILSGAVTASRSTFGLAYDVLIGLILPAACLFVDPIVFERHMGILRGYGLIGYSLILMQTAAFTLWLLTGPRHKRYNAAVAGLLAGGTVTAGIIGILLLPLSVFALVFGVGILGLTPILTAFVYGRHARRAWQSAGGVGDRRGAAIAIVMLVIPFAFASGAHVLIGRRVDAAGQTILTRGVEQCPVEVRFLGRWYRAVRRDDELVTVYRDAATSKDRQKWPSYTTRRSAAISSSPARAIEHGENGRTRASSRHDAESGRGGSLRIVDAYVPTLPKALLLNVLSPSKSPSTVTYSGIQKTPYFALSVNVQLCTATCVGAMPAPLSSRSAW